MTDAELEAIKVREQAASAGPWHVTRIRNGYSSGAGDGFTHPALRGLRVPKRVYEVAPTQVENDVAYMAAAREDVPALLAEVARLRTTLLEIQEMALDTTDDASAESRVRLHDIIERIRTEEQHWRGARTTPPRSRLQQLRAGRTLVR
jgi:hypothetical protein